MDDQDFSFQASQDDPYGLLHTGFIFQKTLAADATWRYRDCTFALEVMVTDGYRMYGNIRKKGCCG